MQISKKEFAPSRDAVIVPCALELIPSGVTLDTTGYSRENISAGHLVIRETSSGLYKPMPLSGDGLSYAPLPEGHTYVGVVVATKSAKTPLVGVVVRGTVDTVAFGEMAKIDMASVIDAVREKLTLIRFI